MAAHPAWRGIRRWPRSSGALETGEVEIGPVEGALIQLASHLEALRIRWALIGGLAVSALAEPRTTGDVDVVISLTGDQEAERAALDLHARGYQIYSVLEHVAGRISTVRLLAPGTVRPRILVDLLFASSGIETEIAALAEPLEVVSGLEIPVARVGHLLAMKVLAAKEARPRDFEDARQLLRVASAEDLHLARESLEPRAPSGQGPTRDSAGSELIAKRGFDRDKDLQGELARLLDLAGEEA